VNIFLNQLKILAICFLCFYTTKESATAAAAQATYTKLTLLLDWKPNTNHTGFFIAKNKGFFADAGIDVSIINPSQSSVTMLVGRGKAEFGVSYATNLIYARQKSIPLTAVASIVQPDTACFVWRKSTGIKSIKDFEGKRYGSLGGEEERATLKFIMEKNGADFSKLKIMTVGVSDFLQATEKNVDIMWEYKAWGMLSAKAHDIEIGSYCINEEFTELAKPSPLIVANEAFLKKHPDLTKRFLKATQKGFEFAITNPKEAAHILALENPGLDQNFLLQSQGVISPLYKENAKYWGYISPKQFEHYQDWMVDTGLIVKNLDLTTFIKNVLSEN